jgi:hypothetical protein
MNPVMNIWIPLGARDELGINFCYVVLVGVELRSLQEHLFSILDRPMNVNKKVLSKPNPFAGFYLTFSSFDFAIAIISQSMFIAT